MLFKKLFRILVLGGAVASAATGCKARAEGQQGGDKSSGDRDGGAAPDGGQKKQESGGGVPGW